MISLQRCLILKSKVSVHYFQNQVLLQPLVWYPHYVALICYMNHFHAQYLSACCTFLNEDDHSFVLSVIFLERLLHIKSQIFRGNHAKSMDNSYFVEVGNNTCRLFLYLCITTFHISKGLHDIVFQNYVTCYVLTNTLIFRQNMALMHHN